MDAILIRKITILTRITQMYFQSRNADFGMRNAQAIDNQYIPHSEIPVPNSNYFSRKNKLIGTPEKSNFFLNSFSKYRL
jgi:hypothetical protein